MSLKLYCQGLPQPETGQFKPVAPSNQMIKTWRKTPMTKTGMAYNTSMIAMLVVSIQVLARKAETTPNGIPTTNWMNTAHNPSSSEIGTPLERMSITERLLYWKE